jgi:hypothetical protein
MTDANFRQGFYKPYDLGLLDDKLNFADHLKIRWARTWNAKLDLRFKYVAGLMSYQEFERQMEASHE